MKETNKKIYPPAQLLIILILQIIIGFLLPLEIIIAKPGSYLGILFIVFGIIINLWADAILKKNNTTVKPDEIPEKLVMSGPYHISRHPMYLGMTALLAGTAVLIGSMSAFLFTLAFFLILQFYYIPLEEKNMEAVFDDEYRRYKKKVRKWI